MRPSVDVPRYRSAAVALLLVVGFASARPARAGEPASRQAGATQTAAASVCGEKPFCTEVGSFAATITDFRASTSAPDKVVTATVRFQNKRNEPLILGYVGGSGVATDDRANRYACFAQTVRGIGVIQGREVDPKFVLQPNESSDGRFEFRWKAYGNQIYGTSFDMELAIREINAVAGSQYTLGREHAIQFHGLGNAPVAAAPPSGTTPPSAPAGAAVSTTPTIPGEAPSSAGGLAPAGGGAAPPATAAAPVVDPCTGKKNCYSAGPFTAEVAQLISMAKPNEPRKLQVNVKFRNVSQGPLILGYVDRSSTAIDDQGNQYSAYGQATGIGLVSYLSADPQFALKPGEARSATFELYHGRDRSVIGTSFTWNVAVAQLEIQANGKQVTTLREYSLNFPEVRAGGAASDLTKKIQGLFKKH